VICLSRKNALFASGDDGGARWAAVASLVETCKLNGVDPQRYFADLLTRLVGGWPNSRIDELMPWPSAPLPIAPARAHDAGAFSNRWTVRERAPS
jgi:transposase